MKKNIPEEIHISKCGAFCLTKCQFLVDRGEDKSFWCTHFDKALWDDAFASRPERCSECQKKIAGSNWASEGL